MGHSNVRIKVRRRKVAHLAAYSRQFTTKNCTIPKRVSKKEIYQVPWNTIVDHLPVYDVVGKLAGKYYWIESKKVDKEGNIQSIKLSPIVAPSWKHEKHPQPKSMMKKHTEWIYNKETHKTEKVMVPSTFPTKKYDDYQKSLWKNLGKAAKMKAYEDEKVKKWERKHPKPCPDDDLFKDEMIPIWEHEREQAIERIRDFVVSMFDKLPLTGRYKESDSKFVEKPVAELKDANGDGHKVNELGPKSKLLNKAQKLTNDEKAKNAKLVATNLKDHKRKKGRIILPKAA